MTKINLENEPLFFNSKTAKPRDRSKIVSIRTGIRELDKFIIGLNKQEVSLVSGSRGSAKSTWLEQLSLEVVQAGRKVALFSGELSEGRVMDWMHLQAAGPNNLQSTQYERYYTLSEDAKARIDQWLYQKLFIYNNKHGKKAAKILESVEDCIKNKGVDIVILDNLMSIDLDCTTYNKNDKQSTFILDIISFAIEHDVHIVVVAHPRKAIGFLRIDDISGTADLTNAVDNVFIIHRVNNDFKRLSKLAFGWRDDNPIYDYDNVIEICKNRDLGYQDEMIGLYFDIPSKRMSCDRINTRIYGWEYDEIRPEEIELPFDL